MVRGRSLRQIFAVLALSTFLAAIAAFSLWNFEPQSSRAAPPVEAEYSLKAPQQTEKAASQLSILDDYQFDSWAWITIVISDLSVIDPVLPPIQAATSAMVGGPTHIAKRNVISGGGNVQIDIEIVEMQLSGIAPMPIFGDQPITVTQSPVFSSQGGINGQSDGQGGIDISPAVPADSLLNVFVEAVMPEFPLSGTGGCSQPLTLFNQGGDAVQVEDNGQPGDPGMFHLPPLGEQAFAPGPSFFGEVNIGYQSINGGADTPIFCQAEPNPLLIGYIPAFVDPLAYPTSPVRGGPGVIHLPHVPLTATKEWQNHDSYMYNFPGNQFDYQIDIRNIGIMPITQVTVVDVFSNAVGALDFLSASPPPDSIISNAQHITLTWDNLVQPSLPLLPGEALSISTAYIGEGIGHPWNRVYISSQDSLGQTMPSFLLPPIEASTWITEPLTYTKKWVNHDANMYGMVGNNINFRLAVTNLYTTPVTTITLVDVLTNASALAYVGGNILPDQIISNSDVLTLTWLNVLTGGDTLGPGSTTVVTASYKALKAGHPHNRLSMATVDQNGQNYIPPLPIIRPVWITQPLTITKVWVDPPPGMTVYAGDVITFSLAVSNTYLEPVVAAILTDTFPSCLAYKTALPAPTVISGNQLIWNPVPNLPLNSDSWITFTTVFTAQGACHDYNEALGFFSYDDGVVQTGMHAATREMVWIGELDFGDAPDDPLDNTDYPTRLLSDGARHIISPGFHLGPWEDDEPDGQPNATATGDDINGVPDDEDGVSFTSALAPGITATLTVEASQAGQLDAWVDFNADADWADAGEQIFTNYSLSAGNNLLSFVVPSSATITSSTFARFRFSSAGNLLVTGLAADGEVEDYQVAIEPPGYGVSISPSQAITGLVGTTITYTLWLSNEGNVLDSFNLTASGIWTTSLSAPSISLNAGTSGAVQLGVSIPVGANEGDFDTAVITATSQADGAVSDSASLTTTATLTPPPVYGVQLVAPVNALTDTAGSIVTYTVWLSNTGNITDSYSISGMGQGTGSLPLGIGPLAPGAGTSFAVPVQIPANASNNQQFITTVTAVSNGDASVTDSVVLTTTATVSSTPYNIYLPLVLKN